MFFFACDVGGKIKPNKTIKNVLGIVEGEIYINQKYQKYPESIRSRSFFE